MQIKLNLGERGEIFGNRNEDKLKLGSAPLNYIIYLFLIQMLRLTEVLEKFITLGTIQLLHKRVRGGGGNLKSRLSLTKIERVGGSEGKCLCNT